MRAITYTEARAKLAATIKQVCEDHAPVIVTKRRDAAVIMMSLEDYESLEATSHLLRSPRNARRLLTALNRAGRRQGQAMSIERLRREVGLEAR